MNVVTASVSMTGAAGTVVHPAPTTPDPASDFSLYWMLNPGEAPSELNVAVGLLTGPDRMEADIDWGDTTAARAVMTISFGIEHVYHEPGIYQVKVTAGDTSHVLTVPAGAMPLTLTQLVSNPLTTVAKTVGATVDCNIDWGDGINQIATAAQLNGPGVQHAYAGPTRALVSITPAGWPNVNGPMAQGFAYANHPPTLTGVSPPSARCGDQISFDGTNLDPQTLLNLYVGGYEFLGVGWSSTSTEIMAIVPGEAQYLIGHGAQNVVVVNAAGNFTLSAGLTITP